MKNLILTTALLISNTFIFGQWQFSGNNIYCNNGRVAIGENVNANVQFEHTLQIEGGDIEYDEGDPNSINLLQLNGVQKNGLCLDFEFNDNGIIFRQELSSTGEFDWMYLDKSSYIGIGTKSPEEKLEVDGNIKLSNPGNGIILKSPNGQEWKLSVDNNGNLSLSEPSKINRIQPAFNISVFPNPASNTIHISAETENFKFFDVEIRNIIGRLIFMKSFNENKIDIDVSDFQTGPYIMHIKDEHGNLLKVTKIVVEK